MLLDMGAQTTTINVVKKGVLQSSRSIDVGGGSLSERIAQSLSIGRKEAEEKKITEGLLSEELKTVLGPLIDTVVTEIKRAIQAFEKKEIQRVVLGGGSSLLPGLKEYLKESLNMEIERIDPFRSVFYPPVLEGTIKEMGPSYAVAVGMALRGLE